MPLTTLDARTALVIIDLQRGVVAIPLAHPAADVVRRAAGLAAAFRHHGLPVVLVRATGMAPGRTEQPPRAGGFPDGFADLVPELGQAASDHMVTKQTWGAFTDTDLLAHLKGQQVTQIVLCGIATSAGVESTARHAHELGFHVTLATDAMTDRSREAHDHSVQRVFPRLGETGLTSDILALLERSRA